MIEQDNKLAKHGGAVFAAEKKTGLDHSCFLDFSANLNPFGCPDFIKEAMLQSLREVTYYPDVEQEKLRKAIANKEGISENWVYAGNGAADLIYRVLNLIHPGQGLVQDPCFLEYERALNSVQAEILHCEIDQFLNSIEKMQQNSVVFLCTPNNPTGILEKKDFIIEIIKKCKDKQIHVILDECFLDFTKEYPSNSLINYLEIFDNLYILKSFTKMYAIPGVRIGYMLHGSDSFFEKMLLCGQSWNVSCVAMAAGVAASNDTYFYKETAGKIQILREQLIKALKELQCDVWEGTANFLLFKIPYPIPLEKYLLDHNILIRTCKDYRGLDEQYYRIAVRTGEENEQLLYHIKSCFSQIKGD